MAKAKRKFKVGQIVCVSCGSENPVYGPVLRYDGGWRVQVGQFEWRLPVLRIRALTATEHCDASENYVRLAAQEELGERLADAVLNYFRNASESEKNDTAMVKLARKFKSAARRD